MNINATLIGQAISFAIFVWFCMKYVWPPLTAAMEERQQQMSEGLANAEKAQEELDLAMSEVENQLKEAKLQSAALIDKANKRANQIVEDAKGIAIQEGDRLKQSAQADIEQEMNSAKEALRQQVAVLAVAGAEKILSSSVDQNAHSEMLNNLAAQL
ncbi:MAG: F0F1 ATP synthase subunit B [Gammaproteobacteria bacterium]|nr:F0F1 ATP synthase subunit B [Gammaproteobacteria bacterium]